MGIIYGDLRLGNFADPKVGEIDALVDNGAIDVVVLPRARRVVLNPASANIPVFLAK